MARITIDQAFEPVEVDLWGSEYRTRARTRTVQKQVQEKLAAFYASEDDDESVKLLGEAFDAWFEPVGDAGKPSELVASKWEADELTVGQLLGFLDSLGDEARPT
jgi:hypothetical protein